MQMQQVETPHMAQLSSSDAAGVVEMLTPVSAPAFKKRRRTSPRASSSDSATLATRPDALLIDSPAAALHSTSPQRRRQDAHLDMDTTDDSAIDAMLEALGIPDSDKKKQKRRKQQEAAEVIELITPPRVHTAQSLVRPGAQRIVAVDQALELSDSDDGDDVNRERRLSDDLSALLASSLSRVNALVTSSSQRGAATTSDRDASVVDLTSPEQQTSAAPPLAAEPAHRRTDVDEDRRAQQARDAILTASSQDLDAPSDDNDTAAVIAPPPLRSPVSSPIVVHEVSEPQSRPRTLSSDHECDALLDDLLLTKPLAERIAAARERSARERAPLLTTEPSTTSTTSHGDSQDKQITAQQSVSGTTEQSATAARKRPRASAARPRSRERLVASVRMERSLDASVTGAALKTALQTHVHNGKALAVELGRPLDCALANVLQWELCDRSGSGDNATTAESPRGRVVAAAMYFDADAFVALLQQSGYAEVRRRVESLQREVSTQASGALDGAAQRTFVVVEGMDKCLIALTKKAKKAKAPSESARASDSVERQTLSFRDVHEMAFQLFMDTTAHTQVRNTDQVLLASYQRTHAACSLSLCLCGSWMCSS